MKEEAIEVEGNLTVVPPGTMFRGSKAIGTSKSGGGDFHLQNRTGIALNFTDAQATR
jgi:hypothetical protein